MDSDMTATLFALTLNPFFCPDITEGRDWCNICEDIWSLVIRIGNWKVKPIIRQIMEIKLTKKPYISCNYN